MTLESLLNFPRSTGRSDKTWTCDPQTPSLVRYHLRYTPIAFILFFWKGAGIWPAPRWSRWQDSNLRPLRPERSALPSWATSRKALKKRKTGFEPATPTMARWCSTTELLPHYYEKSGKQDSNLRPPGPKPGALPSWAISRWMHPVGIEPTTFWFVVRHSIQLRYGCKINIQLLVII